MSRWFDEVKGGDRLLPDPQWNRTERPHRQLNSPTEVLGVWRGRQSQTGTMVTVRFQSGAVAELDAGWFLGFAPDLAQPVFEDSMGYD